MNAIDSIHNFPIGKSVTFSKTVSEFRHLPFRRHNRRFRSDPRRSGVRPHYCLWTADRSRRAYPRLHVNCLDAHPPGLRTPPRLSRLRPHPPCCTGVYRRYNYCHLYCYSDRYREEPYDRGMYRQKPARRNCRRIDPYPESAVTTTLARTARTSEVGTTSVENAGTPLLEISGLCTYFFTASGVVRAVDDFSIKI